MESPLAMRGHESLASPADWRVVCLCARWCGVCREYEGLFREVAAGHPGVHFLWVDVEEEEDVVGDLDVETFPTLLIAQGGQAQFLGPLLPQAGVLDRLLRSLREPSAFSGAADPVAQALLERLRAARG